MQRGVDVKGCEVNRSGVLRIQMSRALAVSRHALMPGPCRDLQGSVRLKNNTRRVDFTVAYIHLQALLNIFTFHSMKTRSIDSRKL